jgi:glyoxylase-like metal-dependent hydrolase (beta-lactamase superfamily II)
VLPAERVVFAGDIVFDQVTPLAIEGHVGNWVDVCSAVDALEVDTVVPGHGPVGDKTGVRDLRGYLRSVHEQARVAFDAGKTAEEAAAATDLGAYASWAEPERIGFNTGRCYQEFRGEI